jgi:hypothetical protein
VRRRSWHAVPVAAAELYEDLRPMRNDLASAQVGTAVAD